MNKMDRLREDLAAYETVDRKRKKRRWLLALLLLLLCLGLAFTLLWFGVLAPKRAEVLVGGNLTQGEIAGLTSNELMEYLQNSAADAQVTIQMNTRPVFESGAAEGDLLIQNPPYNAFDMVVEIYLVGDTDTPVYATGTVPPGYFVSYDKLAVHLGRGEHEAIAFISFYEGSAHITTASADMTLVVES